MRCNDYREAIQELADGGLGPIRRAELQIHLDACPRCRALAADMRRIRELAGSLDRLQPPDSVWLQVAGRLRQQGRITTPSPGEVRHRRHIAALAIAAALVLAIGASIVTLLPRSGGPDAGAPADPASQAGNVPAGDPVQDFANEIRLAEQHYQNAIAKLEEAAKSDQYVMDPQTAEVVKKNLQVIDQAIEESRNALRVQPQSAPARDSLFEALKKKVGVLQDTIVMMNEIRKGTPAGPGESGGGANKS